MRRHRTVVLIALAAVAGVAVVACTLNPQPLPPGEFSGAENSDASADGGRFSPVPTADDAGAGNLDADGQASDASDASDAADDADAG